MDDLAGWMTEFGLHKSPPSEQLMVVLCCLGGLTRILNGNLGLPGVSREASGGVALQIFDCLQKRNGIECAARLYVLVLILASLHHDSFI